MYTPAGILYALTPADQAWYNSAVKDQFGFAYQQGYYGATTCDQGVPNQDYLLDIKIFTNLGSMCFISGGRQADWAARTANNCD